MCYKHEAQKNGCSSELLTESLYEAFVLLQPMPRAIVPSSVIPKIDNISLVLLLEVSEFIDPPLLQVATGRSQPAHDWSRRSVSRRCDGTGVAMDRTIGRLP